MRKLIPSVRPHVSSLKIFDAFGFNFFLKSTLTDAGETLSETKIKLCNFYMKKIHRTKNNYIRYSSL